MADIAPTQTDRPLGEMSGEERKACRLALRSIEQRQHDSVEHWAATLANGLVRSAILEDRETRPAAELSRRERRSATRETGAQDDA